MRPHHHPEEHPEQHPQDTQPSILRKSTSTPNRIPNHHLSCMPPCTLPSRCKHAPAPSPACPTAPERQYRKDTTAPSPAPQIPTNCVPQHHQEQHPKLHSPLRPTCKMQKCARNVTPQNSTCTSTPNCMPPSTLPSILKRCARTAISTSNSTPISTYTSTPNCTPLAPAINLANHFPSLLEVRTPIAFSYLGKNSNKGRINDHGQSKLLNPCLTWPWVKICTQTGTSVETWTKSCGPIPGFISTPYPHFANPWFQSRTDPSASNQRPRAR